MESLVVTNNETDPQTAAMLEGAEIEQGADEAGSEQHIVRTHPPELPPTRDANSATSAFDDDQLDPDALPREQHRSAPD